jgi:hypothetical protein
MMATETRSTVHPRERRDGISFKRLLWVAPLTLVAALAACFAIKFLVQSVDPSLANLAQLQMPMVLLATEGVLAAIVVFAIFALVLPRPILWYRIVGGVALLLSLLPDVALAMGGAPMGIAMRFVGPLTSIGMGAPPGPGGPGGAPAGGPPPGAGGPPPGFLSSMPLNQVLVLMLLHVAVGLVCIVLLTTLTRRTPAPPVSE